MEPLVLDIAEQRRYELWLGERLTGWIDYVRTDGVLALTHAEVLPAFRNQGLGERLVRETLEDVRGHGGSVRPVCPFVAAYVRRHPEYGDLVAGAHQ